MASMALLSSPRLTQWMRLVVSASSGEASSLMAMTAMSMPCWRAPSRTRNGKRPLPAIRPHPAVESVAVASALEAASDMAERVEGTLFDDAALGGFNELDEFLHIRGVAERFLHFLEGLRGVEFGAQQQAVGAFQRVQTLGRESFALQANSVDAVAGGLALGDHAGKRRNVLRDDGGSADVGVTADAAELVHGRECADGGEIFHGDVAC